MSSSLNGATLPVYTTVPLTGPRSTGASITGNGVGPDVTRLFMSLAGCSPGPQFTHYTHNPPAAPPETTAARADPSRPGLDLLHARPSSRLRLAHEARELRRRRLDLGLEARVFTRPLAGQGLEAPRLVPTQPQRG